MIKAKTLERVLYYKTFLKKSVCLLVYLKKETKRNFTFLVYLPKCLVQEFSK